MEMHLNSVVVCLTDNNKKPIREFDPKLVDNNHRKCTAVLPFDTEYKFMIKNTTESRIRVEIDIDGSDVTGKGGLIFSSGVQYLERFFNSDRKFKFVRADSDDVSDPTSPENGIVKLRIWKEKETPRYIFAEPAIYRYPPYRDPFVGGDWYSSNTTSINYSAKSLMSCQVSALNSSCDVGATVEGSKSDQKFGSTYWNGDADQFFFTFYLKGMNSSDNEEYQKFLELKKKYEAS